jgi:hypothetical protein
MTAIVFFKQEVIDFAAWKKFYDDNAHMRTEGGIIASSVYCNADDPNTVLIYNQLPDRETAQNLANALGSEEWKAAFKAAGVKPETIEMWMFEGD